MHWLLPALASCENMLYQNHFSEPNQQVFIVLPPKPALVERG
jgi:hypothetical protein